MPNRSRSSGSVLWFWFTIGTLRRGTRLEITVVGLRIFKITITCIATKFSATVLKNCISNFCHVHLTSRHFKIAGNVNNSGYLENLLKILAVKCLHSKWRIHYKACVLSKASKEANFSLDNSTCIGHADPDLGITFRGYHHGSAPISGLVNSGYDTCFQHPVQIFFSFLIQGEGYFPWN